MKAKMHREFQKGFALTTRGRLLAVIEGYRAKVLARDELRVFAATLEHEALHPRSRVDLTHIVNKRTGTKGIRRMSGPEIEKARERLGTVLDRTADRNLADERPKSVSRRALQHIAQGRCTKVEAVLLLMYFARRISPTRPLQRLEEGERYARFTLAQLEELSGSPKANLSRALQKLREKGFLGTLAVSKRNENQYGLLYVDGPLLSLVRTRQVVQRAKPAKTTTPRSRIDNAPHTESTTLRKDSPKRIPKKSREAQWKGPSPSRDADWERIQLRAWQMKESHMDQAA